MSYRFRMCFYEVEKDNILDFCINFCKNEISKENMRRIIKDNIAYFRKEEKLNNLHRIRFLRSLFLRTFLYWEEYGLLGILISDADGRSLEHEVYFQNSTDQDYEYCTWPNFKVFSDIVEEGKNLTEDYILEVDNDCEDLDYFRRDFVYQRIFDKLYLSDLLREKEDTPYKYFTMECLINFGKEMTADSILLKMLD